MSNIKGGKSCIPVKKVLMQVMKKGTKTLRQFNFVVALRCPPLEWFQSMCYNSEKR